MNDERNGSLRNDGGTPPTLHDRGGSPVRPIGEQTPVIAVGASAGGVEALKRLLGAVPRGANLAIVVVQHLSPSHGSLLTAALHAASPLNVVEVQDGMPLTAGQVHVIPPNMALALQGGHLRLHPRDDAARPPMLIDTFMRSLAAERKAEAIGVVLSGMGSDGTEGLKAIRAAGGRTYAQDPSTATHDAMPRSAIAADVVDLILAPEEIAADLAALARGEPVPSEEDVARAREGDDAFRQIVHLLNVRTGVDVSHYKETTLRRRIMRRMAIVRAAGDAEYLGRLREDRDELNALHDDLFIHVTSFFRDPEVFAALDEHVFPALLQGRANGIPIRLWVPGCSTGEEAYSLAIAAQEFLETRRGDVPVQVFATDISERAIRWARSAEYAADIAEHVSEGRLRRFFEQTSKGYRIARSVRDACVFVRHDLTADPPFSRIDLLSCRNVLIYFDTVLQKQVIPSLHYALNEPGFLVLGHTEALSGFGELFAPVDQKHKIFTRRPGAGRTHAGSPRTAGATARGIRAIPAPPARAPQDLHRALDLLLLSRHVPAAVLVNDALEIVQVRGKTGPYLEPAAGTASLNLLKMARDGLAADLTLLVQRARAENAPVRKEGIRLREDGNVSWLDLEVAPLDDPSLAERHFVVVFRERGAPRDAPRPAPTAAGADEGSLVAELRHELAASKAYVSSVIEQYAVTNQAFAESNEELQTTNEELQSTNEELETAKEELQSSNEELTTVNDELQARYQEVNDLGNDLQNLVASADIPIVIVDRERNVRRFTPKARSAFNLIPADVGRAIAEIRPNVEAPELDAWIAAVIETATVKEAEVRDPDGRWQRLQIRPYQTADRRIDGAVVSVVDVDALKRAVTEARRARDFAAAALETVPVPVLVLDATLRVTSANQAFYEVFRVSPAAAAGKPVTELGAGPWRSADFAARLRDGLERGVPFQNVELEYELADAGRRVVVVSGRVVPEALDGATSLVIAVQDVTELRRIEEERARIQAEEAQRFLNEAGAAMLPESLDYEATLAVVAHLVVPRFADWCIVDLVEAGGSIRQVAAAHVDRVKEQRARELRRRISPDVDPDRGVAWVIRTGKPLFQPDVEDVSWVAEALGMEHPEILRELGARSYVSVPLHGRKGVIGAISFVRGLPGRRFSESDLSVAEGLGQRAGLAVENARLYLAAREAVVARDDFLAIAAHELRTPLSTLSLQLQALAATRGEELAEAVAAGKLERAIKQTRRLASLIDSLLEVSRITAGRLTLHREPTELTAIVRDVAQRLSAAAEAAGCAVTVAAEKAVTGRWDPLRLDQVVTNLLQNAIRYAPGTAIEVSVEGDVRRARLAVRDHGPGIAPERRARIFERFEGGGQSQEGLGLGLYITRQIVEAHGGRIRLESEVGAGTAFLVELPRAADPGGGTSS